MIHLPLGIARWGLTARLIIPFTLVLVAALVLVGALSLRIIRGGMTDSLHTRAAILVDTLATALADPLSLNEVDRIQALLEEAKKADSSVTDALLVNAKGEMDHVVQANAAETDELSSTSQALARQAEAMLALVSRFHLATGA